MTGETVAPDSEWPVDLLYMHLHGEIEAVRREIDASAGLRRSQLSAMRDLLDERYSTQTKALDAAFLAQQTAMATALSAADKAVMAALLAAEKAVTKAEVAAEKRFESVNEFRGQLTDQTATFITRAEAEARFEAITEKLNGAIDRINITTGKDTGAQQSWGYLVGAAGLIAVVVSTFFQLAGK
jgi:hypothetical protein